VLSHKWNLDIKSKQNDVNVKETEEREGEKRLMGE
jgi:hypothetical protein